MGMKNNTSCPQPWVLYTAQHSFHSPSSFNQTSEDKLEVLSSCRPYLALCSLQCQFLTFVGLLRLFHWHIFSPTFSPLLLLSLLVWGLFWHSRCLYRPQAQPSAADPDHTVLSLRRRPMLLSSTGTFVEWKKRRRKRTVRTAATPVSH